MVTLLAAIAGLGPSQPPLPADNHTGELQGGVSACNRGSLLGNLSHVRALKALPCMWAETHTKLGIDALHKQAVHTICTVRAAEQEASPISSAVG